LEDEGAELGGPVGFVDGEGGQVVEAAVMVEDFGEAGLVFGEGLGEGEEALLDDDAGAPGGEQQEEDDAGDGEKRGPGN
jgi:hypothetical protein